MKVAPVGVIHTPFKRKGNILFVKGIDVVDGSPLLDTKPYVPAFGPKEKIRIGWIEGKIL